MTRSLQSLMFAIRQYGSELTLVKPDNGSYDPATGTFSTTGSDTYSIHGYVANYNIDELGNNDVSLGDRKVYIPPLDVANNVLPTPEIDDTIQGLGDDVKIVRVQEMRVPNRVICYICHVRE